MRAGSWYIQKVIQSAVVPVAGLGTRLLPATKSQPKEMLPVARKPIVQYVVEELVSNGIEQMLFVTGRSKASIENHFDHDPELFQALTQSNKHDLLRELEFEALKANFFYTRQRLQRGLGDAILCAENFAGEEPFLVALGDSILGLERGFAGGEPDGRRVRFQARQLRDRGGRGAARGDIALRNRAAGSGTDDVFRVVNLVEKPSPKDAPSNLAIAGRYIFSPVIFDMIRRVKPDKRGEIQLTDAIQFMCEEGRRVMAVKLTPEEKRYDIGNFPSYFESFVEFALADPLYGADFRIALERLLARSPPRFDQAQFEQAQAAFSALFALLLAARLCHVGILWAEETLPLAAAQQMRAGKVLYRDIWFDKPPLAAGTVYACSAASPDGSLRVAGALYALLCCWLAWGFARDLWGEREGMWAAGLLGFFLIFDFPASVIPLAADFLMLAPHLAAVWMAYRRRPCGPARWPAWRSRSVPRVCWCWRCARVGRRRGGCWRGLQG